MYNILNFNFQMSAAIAPVATAKPAQAQPDKNATDMKNIDEVVKQVNKLAETNEQKQVELNDISAKYIAVQGEISTNNRTIAQLILLKNKLETDLLKAKIALLESGQKTSTLPTIEEKQ